MSSVFSPKSFALPKRVFICTKRAKPLLLALPIVNAMGDRTSKNDEKYFRVVKVQNSDESPITPE